MHTRTQFSQALAALQHPNVIAFEGLYLEGDSLHLATEFADGGDLLAAIRAAKERGEHLEEHQIMAWFVQVGTVIEHVECCTASGSHVGNVHFVNNW